MIPVNTASPKLKNGMDDFNVSTVVTNSSSKPISRTTKDNSLKVKSRNILHRKPPYEKSKNTKQLQRPTRTHAMKLRADKIRQPTAAPFTFRHPFTMKVSGPSQSGKTHFVKTLLSHEGYFTPPPRRVIWCYGNGNEKQNNEIRGSCIYPISFHEGIPKLQFLELHKNSLIIFDDLMEESKSSKRVCELFTKGAHHNKISVILIVQNLFPAGTQTRTINLNGNYLVLMKSPQDISQIKTIANRSFTDDKEFFKDAWSKATERPRGYLVLDFMQDTSTEKRVSTNILPGEIYHYFIPERTADSCDILVLK